MTVPFTFATSTNPIPLSNLDANFAAVGDSTNIIYTPPFTGGVAETLSAKLAQTVSVQDFGADPTGAIDSTSAIASAVNSLPSSGGIVMFPPGTYKCNIDISKSDICLMGYGAILLSNSTDPVVQIYDPAGIVTRVFFEGFKIDGNNKNVVGVKIIKATQVNVSNCWIYNCKNHGVQITGDGTGSVTQILVENCRIDAGNLPDVNSAGISIGGGGVATTVRLWNNYITNYPKSIDDSGVNTVGIGNIYESATNAVVSNGPNVYIGDWVENTSMYSTNHYVIKDGRTTIISPHGSLINNIASGAVGQYPNLQNRIFVEDLVALGPTMLIDGGLQGYRTDVGGTVEPDSPRSFRGQCEISGASTSITVTFSNSEPDANYYVTATPATYTGTPATGSNRITQISKSTTGFTLFIETAPAGGATVRFDWIMVR